MIKKTPLEIGKMIRDAFQLQHLTAKQLWAITLFAKHVRLRARNNAAFNNLMNSAFPEASFRQVPKVDTFGNKFEGLEINTRQGDSFTPSNEEEAS